MIKNYYSNQLQKIKVHGNKPAAFQFRSENGDTKWMDLNKESAQTLVDWLYENYPLTENF